MYNRHKEQKKVRILLCQDPEEDHEEAASAEDRTEADLAEDITEASEALIITAHTDLGDRADRFLVAGITARITEEAAVSEDCWDF